MSSCSPLNALCVSQPCLTPQLVRRMLNLGVRNVSRAQCTCRSQKENLCSAGSTLEASRRAWVLGGAAMVPCWLAHGLCSAFPTNKQAVQGCCAVGLAAWPS
eukprot:6203220-Pleurochrysis_carterae.AAC.4